MGTLTITSFDFGYDIVDFMQFRYFRSVALWSLSLISVSASAHMYSTAGVALAPSGVKGYFALIDATVRSLQRKARVTVPVLVKFDENGQHDRSWSSGGSLFLSDRKSSFLEIHGVATQDHNPNVYILATNLISETSGELIVYQVDGSGKHQPTEKTLALQRSDIDYGEFKMLPTRDGLIIVRYGFPPDEHPFVEIFEFDSTGQLLRGRKAPLPKTTASVDEVIMTNASMSDSGEVVCGFKDMVRNKLVAMRFDLKNGEPRAPVEMSASAPQLAAEFLLYLENNEISFYALDRKYHHISLQTGAGFSRVSYQPVDSKISLQGKEMLAHKPGEIEGQYSQITLRNQQGQVERAAVLKNFKFPNPCKLIDR